MKIGMVSPYDWSYPGGVRDHIRQLSDQFINMGHDVRVLAPASRTQDKLIEGYVYNMGRTTPIPINGSIARIACDSALTLRVSSVLRQEQFDVLHVHEPLVPGLPLTALRFSRTITVGTFHAFAHAGVTSPPYLAYASASPFLRPHFQRLSGRIAVSSAAYEFVSHAFPADYRVIPNGINPERFNRSVAPLPYFMDGKQNILFVGRFEKRKGVKYLLRAIPAIREQHPHTRFIFVGEGHLRRAFQRYVEQKGWPDVVFTGYVSDADLPRYYASAHVFCAPATGGESLGIVLLEAMASGTPVVATNIPGYATVVTSDVDGLLIPPRSSSELARAVGYLLTYEPARQRFIHAGLQKARDYAWPRIARHIEDYYYWLQAERNARLHAVRLA